MAVFNLNLPTTKLADVVVPAVFTPYVIQRTTELSLLFQSGIVTPVPELNILGQRGGTTITMPFWNDLSGRSQVLSDTVPLSVNKITSGTDVAVLHARGNAWGSNDLAQALSGDDPMGAIGTLVGYYWAREMQQILLSSLKGIFANSTLAASNVLDISATSGAQQINAEAILDAQQLLGDAKSRLTAIAMHSATENVLAKQNLIDYTLDSEGKPTLPMYMGKAVIVDDMMPTASGVYTTYLFGQGALGYGEGNPPVPTETDRDTLQGDDFLINRRHFVLHPRGVAWTGTPAGVGPTDAELGTGTNWAPRFNQKHIRIVALKHKLVNS